MTSLQLFVVGVMDEIIVAAFPSAVTAAFCIGVVLRVGQTGNDGSTQRAAVEVHLGGIVPFFGFTIVALDVWNCRRT